MRLVPSGVRATINNDNANNDGYRTYGVRVADDMLSDRRTCNVNITRGPAGASPSVGPGVAAGVSLHELIAELARP